MDEPGPAWDTESMGQSDSDRLRRERGGGRLRAAGGAWLALWLLVIGFAASVACRGHDESAGVGGQSGDEGRRSAPWMGTGGVAADPRR